MSIIEVDERFRVTLPKAVRKGFKLAKGERLYVISAGDTVIMKRVPKDPSSKLDKLIGHIKFDRNARRKAERWLLKQGRGWE